MLSQIVAVDKQLYAIDRKLECYGETDEVAAAAKIKEMQEWLIGLERKTDMAKIA